jgi:hypothetical protein
MRWARMQRGARAGLLLSLALPALMTLAAPAIAVDGRIAINQARALAGGVTAGDTVGFPVTLATAGTYVLTGPLTVSDPNTSAIVVTATGVTIDLNGFKIAGPSSCTGFGSTISCSPAGSGEGISSTATGTTVRNGIVRGFPGRGVALGDQARVESVTVLDHGGNGIDVVGGGLVRGCIAYRNGGNGIEGTSAVLVEHSQAHGNGIDGIRLLTSGSVQGNVTRGNAGDGISVNAAAVENNAVYANSGDGVQTTSGSLVRGNAIRSNTLNGLNLDAHTGWAHNSLDANGTAAVGGYRWNNNSCSGSLCP